MKRQLCLTGVLFLLLSCFAVRPVSADDGGVYLVRPGDTLISIAARHGVTVDQLATANGLGWNAWVYVGQRLKIPGRASAQVAPTGSGRYVVRAGDTLSGIAARYGVTLGQLASANGLRSNSWVYVGQRLNIPGQPSSSVASTSTTTPSSEGAYVVRRGDTLISVAARHGVTVGQLASANGLYPNSWVYIGQKLKIPGRTPVSSPSTPSTAPASDGTYVVRPGDTLIGIAARHSVGVSRLAAVNGLHTNSWVYVGQRLKIPGPANAQSTAPATPPAGTTSGTKWIDINLTTQTLVAYAGQTPVYRALISSGTWRTPTIVGTFRVYAKYGSVRMRGPGYDLPNVPYVMYFYRGYGLHGTYWHNNFGTPMSHGCVNLSTPDAKWLYNWAPMGTKVVTHH